MWPLKRKDKVGIEEGEVGCVAPEFDLVPSLKDAAEEVGLRPEVGGTSERVGAPVLPREDAGKD